MQWRVNASEGEIKRKFEPDTSIPVVRRLVDETETAVFDPPERVLGLAVRYEQKKVAHVDISSDEFGP